MNILFTPYIYAQPVHNEIVGVIGNVDATTPLTLFAQDGTELIPPADTCESKISDNFFSWALCGLVSSLGNAVKSIFYWVLGRERADPNLVTATGRYCNLEVNFRQGNADPNDQCAAGSFDDTIVQRTWNAFRVIANSFFVIIFLYAIYQIAFSNGNNAFTIRSLIPRLAIAAILVQLSFFFSKLLISISNDFGAGIDGIFDFVLQNPLNPGGNEFDVGTLLFGSNNQSEDTFEVLAITALGATVSFFTGIISLSAIFAGLFITLLIVFLVLVLRKVLILVLIVLAPIAAIAWVHKETDGFAKAWWQIFSKLLLMYPLIIILLRSGELIARATAQASPIDPADPDANTTIDIVRFVAYFAPYFLIPMTFRFAGGIIGQVADGANRMRGGFVNSRQKATQEKAAARRQRLGSATREGRLFGNKDTGTRGFLNAAAQRLSKPSSLLKSGLPFAPGETARGELTREKQKNTAEAAKAIDALGIGDEGVISEFIAYGGTKRSLAKRIADLRESGNESYAQQLETMMPLAGKNYALGASILKLGEMGKIGTAEETVYNPEARRMEKIVDSNQAAALFQKENITNQRAQDEFRRWGWSPSELSGRIGALRQAGETEAADQLDRVADKAGTLNVRRDDWNNFRGSVSQRDRGYADQISGTASFYAKRAGQWDYAGYKGDNEAFINPATLPERTDEEKAIKQRITAKYEARMSENIIGMGLGEWQRLKPNAAKPMALHALRMVADEGLMMDSVLRPDERGLSLDEKRNIVTARGLWQAIDDRRNQIRNGVASVASEYSYAPIEQKVEINRNAAEILDRGGRFGVDVASIPPGQKSVNVTGADGMIIPLRVRHNQGITYIQESDYDKYLQQQNRDQRGNGSYLAMSPDEEGNFTPQFQPGRARPSSKAVEASGGMKPVRESFGDIKPIVPGDFPSAGPDFYRQEGGSGENPADLQLQPGPVRYRSVSMAAQAVPKGGESTGTILPTTVQSRPFEFGGRPSGSVELSPTGSFSRVTVGNRQATVSTGEDGIPYFIDPQPAGASSGKPVRLVDTSAINQAVGTVEFGGKTGSIQYREDGSTYAVMPSESGVAAEEIEFRTVNREGTAPGLARIESLVPVRSSARVSASTRAEGTVTPVSYTATPTERTQTLYLDRKQRVLDVAKERNIPIIDEGAITTESIGSFESMFGIESPAARPTVIEETQSRKEFSRPWEAEPITVQTSQPTSLREQRTAFAGSRPWIVDEQLQAASTPPASVVTEASVIPNPQEIAERARTAPRPWTQPAPSPFTEVRVPATSGQPYVVGRPSENQSPVSVAVEQQEGPPIDSSTKRFARPWETETTQPPVPPNIASQEPTNVGEQLKPLLGETPPAIAQPRTTSNYGFRGLVRRIRGSFGTKSPELSSPDQTSRPKPDAAILKRGKPGTDKDLNKYISESANLGPPVQKSGGGLCGIFKRSRNRRSETTEQPAESSKNEIIRPWLSKKQPGSVISPENNSNEPDGSSG